MATKANIKEILSAYKRVRNKVHQTPVVTSETVNNLTGKNVFFKCENFQKTGSFKARGALNAIISKLERQKDSETENKVTGVVTHSSGNHGKRLAPYLGRVLSTQKTITFDPSWIWLDVQNILLGQALAWAAKQLGKECTVVVPQGTMPVKINAIENYGGKVVLCEPNPQSRVSTCNKISAEEHKLIIPPYDDFDVICGQGTVAVEFLQQVPQLDAIFVSLSGGGLVIYLFTYKLDYFIRRKSKKKKLFSSER
jgi:serine racemase